MAFRRCALLTAILTTVCLDLSSVVVAAAVLWNPKMAGYDGYNLDKGPVFYEVYYPDTHNAYQDKYLPDRSAVLETSFQVPVNHFAYSAENAERPVANNESPFVGENERRQTVVEPGRNYETASRLVSVDDRRSMILDGDESSRAASIEEISKLVTRAISRDLENWSALERYLERATNQGRPMSPSLSGVYTEEGRESTPINSDDHPFRANRFDFNLPGSRDQKENRVLQKPKANDAIRRPAHLEEIDASRMSVADIPFDSSSPPENIFQPRPQVIKYTFFKRPATRLDKQTARAIDISTPRSYGDNLVREEIANESSRDEPTEPKSDVKVTSIQVSELPHKTRHHHGEWPKRDYSARRHRTPADSSAI